MEAVIHADLGWFKPKTLTNLSLVSDQDDMQ
jgi:hypothetical protein